MRLDWLSAVCRSEGPFATVVLDVSHNTEDTDHRAEVRRKDVVERLAAQGAPGAVVERVDAALADADPAVGEAARVLVVDEREVLVDVLVQGPPCSEQVAWAPLPDLFSVVNAVPEQVSTVVVRVDEEGGELLAPGDTEPEAVTGRTKPVHKARGGGWSHRSMQARVEEGGGAGRGRPRGDQRAQGRGRRPAPRPVGRAARPGRAARGPATGARAQRGCRHARRRGGRFETGCQHSGEHRGKES